GNHLPGGGRFGRGCALPRARAASGGFGRRHRWKFGTGSLAPAGPGGGWGRGAVPAAVGGGHLERARSLVLSDSVGGRLRRALALPPFAPGPPRLGRRARRPVARLSRSRRAAARDPRLRPRNGFRRRDRSQDRGGARAARRLGQGFLRGSRRAQSSAAGERGQVRQDAAAERPRGVGGERRRRRNMIQLREATKVYRRGKTEVRALYVASLDVPRGQFLSVMGASGSGKSTLLNLLGALDLPTSGSVRRAALDLAKLDDGGLWEFGRRRLGFVFQFFNLLPTLTAVENGMLPGLLAGGAVAELDARAHSLLETVGLAGREHHRPDELSGGEMQRV